MGSNAEKKLWINVQTKPIQKWSKVGRTINKWRAIEKNPLFLSQYWKFNTKLITFWGHKLYFCRLYLCGTVLQDWAELWGTVLQEWVVVPPSQVALALASSYCSWSLNPTSGLRTLTPVEPGACRQEATFKPPSPWRLCVWETYEIRQCIIIKS